MENILILVLVLLVLLLMFFLLHKNMKNIKPIPKVYVHKPEKMTIDRVKKSRSICTKCRSELNQNDITELHVNDGEPTAFYTCKKCGNKFHHIIKK